MSFLERISDDGWQVITEPDVTHLGMDDWPEQRKAAILTRIADLQTKYGLQVTVDARPSTTGPGPLGPRKAEHYNFAEESDALMGVRSGETTLHVNPKVKDDRWLSAKLSDGDGTFVAQTIEEVVTHEFGHSLQGHLEQTDQLETVAELARPFVRAANGDTNTLDSIRNEISPYAAETPAEGVAEAFLQHEKGINNEWSDHVGTIIQRNYTEYLRSKTAEFHADHDQSSHGNWAHGGIPSNEYDALRNVDEQIRSSVQAMLRDRRKVEPTYTELLSDMAAGSEGRMIGLDFKFKNADGVLGKIQRKVRDKGIPAELAAEGISDALRYTMAFPPDEYADGVKSAVKALQDRGIEFLDFEDNWIRGDAYNGINAVFEDPETGLKIELQFHTPESFNVKNRIIHKDYELIREHKGTTADRLRAFERMRRISDDVIFPEGFISLCQEVGDPCRKVFRSKRGVI